jgi:alpha-L-fucosidase 2
MSALYCDNSDYGSYQVLANLTVDIGNVGTAQSYNMSLDLETAVYTSNFRAENVDYERLVARPSARSDRR